MREPSGEKHTEKQSFAASIPRISFPLATSQSLILQATFICRSRLPNGLMAPESIRVPSGEKATEATSLGETSKVRISAPLVVSNSFIVLSKCVVVSNFSNPTIVPPSGENPPQINPSVCPSKPRIGTPVFVSHRLIVMLELAAAMVLPSGEKVTHSSPTVLLSEITNRRSARSVEKLDSSVVAAQEHNLTIR